MVQLRYVTVSWSLFYTTLSGRIMDNRQIDNQNLQIDKLQMYNWQIDNRQIDNLQIDNRQIDDMTFSKIDSAIPFCLASWIWKLTTWCWYLKYRGWVGEGLSNFFILASWVRNWQHGIVALKKCIFWYDRRGDRAGWTLATTSTTVAEAGLVLNWLFLRSGIWRKRGKNKINNNNNNFGVIVCYIYVKKCK